MNVPSLREPVAAALTALPSRAGLGVVAPLPRGAASSIIAWPRRTLTLREYVEILSHHLGMGWVFEEGVIAFLSPVEIRCQAFGGVPDGWIGFHTAAVDRRFARLCVLQGDAGTRRVARLFGAFAPARVAALLDGERLTAEQMSARERQEVASFLAWLHPRTAPGAAFRDLRVFRLPWYMAVYYGQLLDRPLVADQSRSLATRPLGAITLTAQQPATVKDVIAEISRRAERTLTVDRRWSEAQVVVAVKEVPAARLIGLLARALGAPLREIGGAIHLGYPVPRVDEQTGRGLKPLGFDFAVTIDGQALRQGGLARLALSATYPGLVMLARCGKETVQVIAFAHDPSGTRPFIATEVNCGLSSLRWLAQLLGSPIQEERWTSLLAQYNQPSVSMFDIARAAQEIGLPLKGFQISAAELAALRSPAIINTDRFHFMALVGFTEKGVEVRDGESDAAITIPPDQFAKRYSGYALLPASAAAGLTTGP